MPIRCKSIAGQKVTLGAGDRLIAGCELIDGSVFINGNEACEGGTEVFAPIIIGEDDMCAYAGANGATDRKSTRLNSSHT